MNQLQQQQSPNKSHGGCFRCHKVGHWAQDCPQNPNNRSPVSHPSSSADYPRTHCPCGAGFCEIRVSQSAGSPGRKYYCCPGKFENYCGYFKWCDQLKREQILEVQPKPFPICRCGAGVCRVKIEEIEPNVGRAYFACHMKKGDGECKFRQWVDLCEPSMEVDQELLSYEAEMQIDAVEMMFSPEFSHQAKDQVQMYNEVAELSDVAYGTSAGSPKVHHHSVRNNISGNGLNSELTTENNDNLLKMNESQLEFVEASTDTATLKIPFSGGSSSVLDPVIMLEDKSPSASSLNMDELLPKQQNEGGFMTGSLLHALEKLVICVQKDLITLNAVGSKNHENVMKEYSHSAALDRLRVDQGLFPLQVIEYIKQAAVLSCLEQAIKNDDGCTRELLNRYTSQKTCFEQNFRVFCEAGKAYVDSNERLSSLREKASCLREILLEIEDELVCCEVENAGRKECLLEITKAMSVCKASMQAAVQEAEDVLKPLKEGD